MSQNNGQQFNLGIKHQLFNNEVRKRRLELGLTQKQLAKLCGLGKQTVGHIETFRSYPIRDQGEKIAKVLESTVEVLFPIWTKEFIGKLTTVVTEHLITERMLEHPELRLLPAEAGSTEEIEDQLDKELLRKVTAEVLDTLTPREQRVLQLRYGMGDPGQEGEERARPMNLEEVGREFGVTRERIRQIEGKAIRKLKHPTRIHKLRPFL